LLTGSRFVFKKTFKCNTRILQSSKIVKEYATEVCTKYHAIFTCLTVPFPMSIKTLKVTYAVE